MEAKQSVMIFLSKSEENKPSVKSSHFPKSTNPKETNAEAGHDAPSLRHVLPEEEKRTASRSQRAINHKMVLFQNNTTVHLTNMLLFLFRSCSHRKAALRHRSFLKRCLAATSRKRNVSHSAQGTPRFPPFRTQTIGKQNSAPREYGCSENIRKISRTVSRMHGSVKRKMPYPQRYFEKSLSSPINPPETGGVKHQRTDSCAYYNPLCRKMQSFSGEHTDKVSYYS